MIGSIGVNNCYVTSYNNTKTNWGSDKWTNTLFQTIDKDINNGTDVNRVKKYSYSFYLALSGNAENNLKQVYSEYKSENYRIVPDNEAECYE